MFILLSIFGMCVGLAGFLFGVGGMAGLILSAIGEESVWLEASLILAGGIVVAMIGGAIFSWSIRRSGQKSRKVFLGTLIIAMGAFLTWFGLGVQGILNEFNLDPSGTFAYSSGHPVMWLMIVGGIAAIFSGIGIAFGKADIGPAPVR